MEFGSKDKNFFQKNSNSSGGLRINAAIRAREVRVIGPDGADLGVMLIQDAMRIARDHKLDLVEISPNTAPPVCKMLDYGKYKYQLEKKRSESKKKQKVVELKEIKIRYNISEGDYGVKYRKIRELLGDDCKVKVSMRFRGREITHQDIGRKLFERLISELSDIAKLEKELSKQDNNLSIVFIKS